MHLIVLRFTDRRPDAPRWMAAHNAWLDAGFADGIFLAAGSLHDGTGGCVLAAGVAADAIAARVAQDPFVAHGVVTADITGFQPHRTQPGLAALTPSPHP